jgi:hypothetical protein
LAQQKIKLEEKNVCFVNEIHWIDVFYINIKVYKLDGGDNNYHVRVVAESLVHVVVLDAHDFVGELTRRENVHHIRHL